MTTTNDINHSSTLVENTGSFSLEPSELDQQQEKVHSEALKAIPFNENSNVTLSGPPPGTPPRHSQKRPLDAPGSPEERRVHIIPPTPRKKRPNNGPARESNTPALAAKSFGTEMPLAIIDQDPIDDLRHLTGLPMIGNVYQLPSNKPIIAIQQPIQEKPTCGPGCVLMIASDHIEKLKQNDNFWNWYGSTRLANASSLLNGFRFLGIPAKICKLTCMPPNLHLESNPSIEFKHLNPLHAVDHIKETVRATNRPVILAITHPLLMGHWIIVDGFENGQAWVRDPYTGKAFALPEATLSKWLLEKDPVQEMIYFPETF